MSIDGTKPLRIVTMATGPFAAPAFEALCETRHTMAALVTQPLRPARGRRSPPPNALREIAAAHGAPILDPQSVNSPEAHQRLRELAPDLVFVADYGQILSAATLEIARLGGLNLHGSLLPKYRGAAPVAWAIYHGEEETGVTVIHMTSKVDAGPCVAQARLRIEPDETAGELEGRLARLGAEILCQTIDELAEGRTSALPQDPQQATRAPRLKKSDGQIDWSRSAEEIERHIRAMWPWPKCYTFWRREPDEPLRIIVRRASVESAMAGVAGCVLEASGDRFVVAAGSHAVRLEEVQPSGKRLLTAGEFLRGYRIKPGAQLGDEG